MERSFYTLSNTLSICANVFPQNSLLMDNTHMDKREIKDVLKDLMRERQVSQTKISDGSGVPQPTISRILKGTHKTLELGTIRSLAAYFNVSVDQMIGDEPLDNDEQWRGIKRMWMEFPAWKKTAAEGTVKALANSVSENNNGNKVETRDGHPVDSENNNKKMPSGNALGYSHTNNNQPDAKRKIK